jgi:hypothetical protein
VKPDVASGCPPILAFSQYVIKFTAIMLEEENHTVIGDT